MDPEINSLESGSRLCIPIALRAFSATVPGLRRLGAARSSFLGAAGCICVWGLPRYLKPLWHHFWIILGVNLAPFWQFGGENSEILGSWGVRGSVWEPCWTPWPARGAQVPEKARKGSPLGFHFWDHFRDFSGIFGSLLKSRFLQNPVLADCAAVI